MWHFGQLFVSYLMLNVDSRKPMEPVFSSEGVCILESRHGRSFEMPETRDGFFKVLYPFRGSGWLLVGRTRYRLQAKDVVLIPPQAPHRITDSSPMALYIVCIEREFVERISGATAALARLANHSQPIWADEMARLIRSLLIELSCPTRGSPAWVTAQTWQILGFIWRAEHKTPAQTQMPPGLVTRERIAAYLRELPWLFHEELDLDAAALRVGLSRRRFSQLFREEAGESWLQAIRRLRIGHAQRLLTETGHSVTAIAFQSGFSDLSHFHRVFRSCSNGLTPESWRRISSGMGAARMD
jgi:AraC-like DNA-binding protein